MSAARRIWGVCVLLAFTTVGSVARADDAVAAQALFDQGKSALAARDYAQACPKFEESLRLQPALGTLLNLADCYEREGRLATAWSKFLELAAKAGAAGQTERAKIGKKRAAALAPRLSNLVIVVAEATPGLEVKRDGTVAGQVEWGTPIPADPGPHTVEAEAPGKQPWSVTVNVGDGAQTSTVTVPPLAAAPAPGRTAGAAANPEAAAAPHPLGGALAPRSGEVESHHGLGAQKVLALVSAGIGVGGIAVGSYFGFQSMAKHTEASGVCSTTACSPAGVDRWKEAGVAGDRADVAFAVGAAGLAGAALLWFTAPKREGSSAPAARLGIGPGSVEMTGAW